MRIDVKWDGKTYAFDPEVDLTVGRLRVLKAALGDEYGRYITLISLSSQGDADALAAIYWVMRTVNGDPVDVRNIPDFAIGQFLDAYVTACDVADEREQARVNDEETDPNSQGPSPSGPSETSSSTQTPTS